MSVLTPVCDRVCQDSLHILVMHATVPEENTEAQDRTEDRDRGQRQDRTGRDHADRDADKDGDKETERQTKERERERETDRQTDPPLPFWLKPFKQIIVKPHRPLRAGGPNGMAIQDRLWALGLHGPDAAHAMMQCKCHDTQ